MKITIEKSASGDARLTAEMLRQAALTDSIHSLFEGNCISPPSPLRMRCGNTHLSITLCNVDGSGGLLEMQTRIQQVLRVPHEDERLLPAGTPLS